MKDGLPLVTDFCNIHKIIISLLLNPKRTGEEILHLHYSEQSLSMTTK
jgi:hypothetical protein